MWIGFLTSENQIVQFKMMKNYEQLTSDWQTNLSASFQMHNEMVLILFCRETASRTYHFKCVSDDDDDDDEKVQSK